MGVQRGVDRRNDWLWRPLKRGAGRGAGGGQCGTWRWSGGGRERRHDPRKPARTGAAEEPEEAERLGQGQAAGRRALGCRPQAEGLGDHAAEAEEGRREEGGQQVAGGRAGLPPQGRSRRQDAPRRPRPGPAGTSGIAPRPVAPSPIKVAVEPCTLRLLVRAPGGGWVSAAIAGGAIAAAESQAAASRRALTVASARSDSTAAGPAAAWAPHRARCGAAFHHAGCRPWRWSRRTGSRGPGSVRGALVTPGP